jgi:hypothetical protein
MTASTKKTADNLPEEATAAQTLALVEKYARAMYGPDPSETVWDEDGYEDAKSAACAFMKQKPQGEFALGMAWHAHTKLREGIANEASVLWQIRPEAVNLFNALALYLRTCGYPAKREG